MVTIISQAWTIAQAAKWCWQFACINTLAARRLVDKRDDIRQDGAGVLFLETQQRRCRFMQSPLLLELQAIAALQHVASDSGMLHLAITTCCISPIISTLHVFQARRRLQARAALDVCGTTPTLFAPPLPAAPVVPAPPAA